MGASNERRVVLDKKFACIISTKNIEMSLSASIFDFLNAFICFNETIIVFDTSNN